VHRLLGRRDDRGGRLPGELLSRIAAERGRGRGLPAAARTGLEEHYGLDLSTLRLHDDAESHALNDALGARAFTSGHDIFLGPAAPKPATGAGQRLLAHEVSHAIDASTGLATTPNGHVSAPGDRAEHRAEEHARRLGSDPGSDLGSDLGPERTTGELGPLAGPGPSAGGLHRQVGGGPGGTTTATPAAPSPAVMSPPRYRVNIVGHASPRWRRPGASTADQRNLELSRQRALAVEDAIRAAFRLRVVPVEFDFVSRIDDGGDDLAVDWRGSDETLAEAGGDRDADLEELRRVDVGIEVLQTAHLTTGVCEERELPVSTDRWSVYVDSVVSAALGGAGSWGYGRLKNRLTGQVVKGSWVGGGGGGGLDLPIPAASVDSGWKDFTTESNLTFESFDGTPVRYSELSIGLGIGYGSAYFSFSWFMDPVYVGGVAFNQWGVGGSVTAGPWEFTQPIPDPPTVVEEIEIPYTEEVGTSFGAVVTFPTGSPAVADDDLDHLAILIDALP
jgi:hypothetical protein